MLGLGSYSQFPEFLIYMFHICRNSLADSSQIVVIQLLPFRRHGSKKSPACKHQVFSSAEHLLADQEIFLFCPNRRNHPFRSGIAKKPYQAKGLSAYCLHGAKKRGLLIPGVFLGGILMMEAGWRAGNHFRHVFRKDISWISGICLLILGAGTLCKL